MKEILQILIAISAFSFLNAPQLCSKLQDGKYHVIYDSSFKEYENFELIVNKGTYVQVIKNGDSIRGNLHWFYDCNFKLDPFSKTPHDTTEFEKLILKSFGEDCIDLREVKGDTIYFITRHLNNLHITINTGKFIRRKEY